MCCRHLRFMAWQARRRSAEIQTVLPAVVVWRTMMDHFPADSARTQDQYLPGSNRWRMHSWVPSNGLLSVPKPSPRNFVCPYIHSIMYILRDIHKNLPELAYIPSHATPLHCFIDVEVSSNCNVLENPARGP